jgi:hypothetical protein
MRCRDGPNARKLLEDVHEFKWKTVRPFRKEIARAVLAPGLFACAAEFAETVRAHADEPERAEVLAEGWAADLEGNQVEVAPEQQCPSPESVLEPIVA